MLRFNRILYSTRAAIDLASILVGIIVIGIIGGVVAAVIFAVIPWAQDNAAKASLDSVITAESAHRGFVSDNGTGATYYANSDGLADFVAPNGKKSLLKKTEGVQVITDAAGQCFLATSLSQSGRVFFTSDKNQKNFKEYDPETTPDETSYCADITTIIDGPPPVLAFDDIMWSRVSNAPAGINFSHISASDDMQTIALTPDYGNSVYVSKDGGVTWESHVILSMELNWNDVEVSADGQTIITVIPQIYGEPRISRDGGETWNILNIATTGWSVGFSNITISDDSQRINIFQGGADARIFRSSDNGFNWTSNVVSTENSYISATAASNDGKKIYAALISHGGGLYTSNDYGVTWELSLTGQTNVERLSTSSNGQIAYLTGTDGYYKTIDGGATWVPSDPNIGYGLYWNSIIASDDGTKLVATLRGTLPSQRTVLTSTDGGANWVRNDKPEDVPAWGYDDADVSPDGTKIYVIGNEVNANADQGLYFGKYVKVD